MFPKYKEIRLPLLAELVSRGGASRPSYFDDLGRTIYDALADYFNLPLEALNEVILEKNGTERSKWKNMVRWTRNDLKKEGLLLAHQRGVWQISDEGIKQLEDLDIDNSSDERTFRQKLSIDPKTFEVRQERANEIGEIGESYVFQYEREQLKKYGLDELASGVTLVSKINVAAGYDILSFEKDSTEKYIEVKTSVGSRIQFELTRNELETARRLRSSYWIYRLVNVEKNPFIHKIQDPWQLVQTGKLLTNPSSYSITFSESYNP